MALNLGPDILLMDGLESIKIYDHTNADPSANAAADITHALLRPGVKRDVLDTYGDYARTMGYWHFPISETGSYTPKLGDQLRQSSANEGYWTVVETEALTVLGKYRVLAAQNSLLLPDRVELQVRTDDRDAWGARKDEWRTLATIEAKLSYDTKASETLESGGRRLVNNHATLLTIPRVGGWYLGPNHIAVDADGVRWRITGSTNAWSLKFIESFELERVLDGV